MYTTWEEVCSLGILYTKCSIDKILDGKMAKRLKPIRKGLKNV